LDHAQLTTLPIARKLDVGAAAFDADSADHLDRGVTELLIALVRKRHLRGDRDGVAGVNAHRVEILDRADDDDVVVPVANHLELELVPAEQALLDEHLPDRALLQGAAEQLDELPPIAGGAATMAAQRERGPQDYREAEVDRRVLERGDDRRLGHLQAGQTHGLAKELAVLGAVDHIRAGSDQLDSQ